MSIIYVCDILCMYILWICRERRHKAGYLFPETEAERERRLQIGYFSPKNDDEEEDDDIDLYDMITKPIIDLKNQVVENSNQIKEKIKRTLFPGIL